MSAPLIYKKMSEVMSAIKSVGKDQKNLAQGFKFRGIDQFVNSLYPALTSAKVFMTPRVLSATHSERSVTRGNGKEGIDKTVNLMVEYDFYAEDGSKVTVGPIAAEGLDSGDKATNKALSAALKYALIQTFSIPTEDMTDGDLESPELGVSKSVTKESVSAAITKAATTAVESTNVVESTVPAANQFKNKRAKPGTTTKASEDVF